MPTEQSREHKHSKHAVLSWVTQCVRDDPKSSPHSGLRHPQKGSMHLLSQGLSEEPVDSLRASSPALSESPQPRHSWMRQSLPARFSAEVCHCWGTYHRINLCHLPKAALVPPLASKGCLGDRKDQRRLCEGTLSTLAGSRQYRISGSHSSRETMDGSDLEPYNSCHPQSRKMQD